MRTTRRKTSGRISAQKAATGDPKSCPITARTSRAPSARDERQYVADQFGHAERGKVSVIRPVPARSSTIAALIGGNDVKTGLGKREDDLAPRVCKFGESVQQDDQRAVAVEPGFQNVHRQAIYIGQISAANAIRERQRREIHNANQWTIFVEAAPDPSECS